MPKLGDIRVVPAIGSGPIVTGQTRFEPVTHG